MASGITINSNLAALNAQRRLGASTQSVQQSFTRLSSGLRINKASDDAAGLAISESLNVDARVYTQGIRNLNDGISLTNIAEGALQELTNITIRQRELATQSANGTLSFRQRQALNQEANALVDEFNRITQSTDFNGIELLDKSLSELRVQGGCGADGSISFEIADELARTVGTGTFGAMTSFTMGSWPRSVSLGDVNRDGILDMVTADYNALKASVSIGNGDGTFKARASFTTGTFPWLVTLGDVSGDGLLDIVTADSSGDTVSVIIGNGDGTFKARSAFTTGTEPRSVSLGDVNGDGILDMVTADRSAGKASVFIGNGNGSFKARSSFAAGIQPFSVTLGDLTGDGILDMVTTDSYNGVAGNSTSIFIGNGDGSFRARSSFSTGASPLFVSLGDVTGDGILDMLTADFNANTASVFIGNGNGTFYARSSFTTGTAPRSVTLGDVTGDGVLDIVTVDSSADTTSVIIGNGDGSFKARSSYTTGTTPMSVSLGDVNQDGVLDIAVAAATVDSACVLLSNTQEVTTTPRLNLCTRQGALDAMATIDATLERISSELGSIGSVQSRLGVAVNTLSVARENYLAARSQITDADVALESAQLLKNQILQQAGAAVLAQANQAPALALMLLRSG
jgi:flagellin-like hook-associated protein FlgL